MRLTLIISSLDAGGAERVLTSLANYWQQQGHDVTLVTFEPNNKIPFYDVGSKINLVQLNCIDQTTHTSLITRFLSIFKRLHKVRYAFITSKPDVVVSFVDITNILTLIASFNLKIPVIVSERTNPHFYKIPILYNTLRSIFYPKAKAVVVQTESALKYFVGLPNTKIIPNLIIQKNSGINFNRPFNSVIGVGRLCKNKDFPTLIKAFYKVQQNHQNLILTIFGEGPDRKNLEDLIRSLSLEEKVFLPGKVKNIEDQLLKADLFVFPSLYEGFPNALSEAMAVGLPIIASDCSGNIDLINDKINGRVFFKKDQDQLANIMEELINNQDQRKSLGLNSKKSVEQYAPEIIFKMWDDLLSNSVHATFEKQEYAK
ncbi:MAG: GalNAc-alpha-(1-_4)-GalNAc-alpha-(1-_3)-diNAcBac-PP-undecaprenol alpha-1,4-N-acetyl-D-galactosaminyltransferase [Holosporales bacterium]